MRPIKFRYTCQNDQDEKDIIQKIFTLEQIEEGHFYDWWQNLPDKYFKIVARDRFTGLHDKNNKECYENDIISLSENDRVFYDETLPLYLPVVFHKGTFGVRWKENFRPLILCEDEFEIKGNVSANPELLGNPKSDS